MSSQDSHKGTMKGFTLIELLVVVAIIAVLISILLPGLSQAREQAKRVKCAANMRSIGQAVANCSTENNGYGPTWDDGESGGSPGRGHQTFMLTWVDVLFDNDHLGNVAAGICPSDLRGNNPTEARGRLWNFQYVDNIGQNETPKFGIRTSYAINSHMQFNFDQDKYHDDEARQVYAMDGWWTWFGSMNAAWVMSARIYGYPRDPMNFPNWQGSMIAWRHGREFRANALFLDGHVNNIQPLVPHSIGDLRDRTVDTVNSFTWLPAEKNNRLDGDIYAGNPGLGQIENWRGRKPRWNDGDFGRGDRRLINGRPVPYDFPDELSATQKTNLAAWRKFPNDWRDRQ